MTPSAEASAYAEAVFREEHGRIIAKLIRLCGSFDRAEEAMQEAFSAALRHWAERGVPDNPAAWITAAAYRKLIDARNAFDVASTRTGSDPVSISMSSFGNRPSVRLSSRNWLSFSGCSPRPFHFRCCCGLIYRSYGGGPRSRS